MYCRLLIGLQFTKSGSTPTVFKSGCTRAHFQTSANVPESNDRLIILVIVGNNTSIRSITSDVGMGSTAEFFFPHSLISVRTSSSVSVLKLLR